MRSPSVQRRGRAVLAGVLLTLTVVPAALAAGPTRLEHAALAGTGAQRTFEVTYVSRNDAPPAWVRISVDGAPHGMAPVDPRDTVYRDGARYRIAITLSVGAHAYAFSALDSRERHPVALAGGTVTVAAPATPPPTPTPAPTASPRPTPRATASPPPARQPSASPVPSQPAQPTPAAAPTGSADPSPATPATPAASGTPGSSVAASPSLDPSGDPGAAPSSPRDGARSPLELPPALAAEPRVEPPSPVPSDADRPHGDGRETESRPEPAIGTGAATTGGSDEGPGNDDPAAADIVVDAAGLPSFGSERWLRLAAWSASVSTTTGTVTALALFALRRRRENEAASSEPAPEPTPSRSLAQHLTDESGEEHMPRWRRPSLIAARRADPVADPLAVAAQRLTFARSSVEPDPDRERRWIRYRMVRLSDAPDEVLGAEIGRLDAGDEVELLDRAGSYWRVLTPTGHTGWVHRMTLGEVVAAPAPEPRAGAAPAAQRAPEPGDGLAARLISERAVRA